MPHIISAPLDAKGLAFGIAVSRFNSLITDSLFKAAIETLTRHGVRDADITVAYVPGCFELGLAAKKLAETKKFNAVITLGAVIRGATSHYDLVCSSSASAVSSAGLESGIPVIFGVVTTETIEQAIERAGTKAGNKGADAALAAIEMAVLCKALAA
jgi:6,7-dimethyl-8-ribityllumazine synthase